MRPTDRIFSECPRCMRPIIFVAGISKGAAVKLAYDDDMVTQHRVTCTLKPYRCSVCGQIKPAEDFRRNRTRPRGRHYACKLCMKLVEAGLSRSEILAASQLNQ